MQDVNITTAALVPEYTGNQQLLNNPLKYNKIIVDISCNNC